MAGITKIQYFNKLIGQLKDQRNSFDPLYKELADYIDPARGQFNISDHNKGDRRNRNIIDSTATFASDVLGAGLTSGIASPSRPWFKLTTPDPDLAEFGKVREWLQAVQEIMTTSHNRSNLNSTLPVAFKDCGIFATSPFLVSEDFTGNVIHTTPFDVGTYYLGEDPYGRVNTFAREFRMTVQQLVDMFGEKKDGKYDWSNFSQTVKDDYERGNTEKWIEVVHVVCPNRNWDSKQRQSKFKKFASVYYEKNRSTVDEVFLRESGYDLFPILGLRWGGKAMDVYGTSCPGMMSLGDIKQLQHGELRGAEAIDKMVRPPMKGSSLIKTTGANLVPGGMTWVDETQPGGDLLEAAYTVNYPFNQVEAKQQQIRNRIEAAFFKNLFLMLSNDQRSNITATEINTRYEEKLVMLGPVLQQFNTDGLDPFIDLSFEYHLRQGKLPPPPEELRGQQLKVEYISVIANAQKAIGINSDDRFLNTLITAAKFDEGVRDKVNLDEYMTGYADKLSINPRVIRSDEEVQSIRQARAQAAQQQMQAEAMQQSARAAKDLSQANLEGDSLLTQMAGA